MKIVVLVKWSPDASSERRYSPDFTVDRDPGKGRLSELDEYPVEQALRAVEAGLQAEIVYLSVGPASAEDALRRALSMGGDRAVHVLDDAIHGFDYLSTSLVLAKAVQKIGFDVVIAGMASTEAGGGVVPAMLAERLGVAQATLASEVLSLDAQKVVIRRESDTHVVVAEAALPAVVSVTYQIGEARYPAFRRMMAAKKMPVEVLSLADLGLVHSDVGSAVAATAVDSARKSPASGRPHRERPGRWWSRVGRISHEPAAHLTANPPMR